MATHIPIEERLERLEYFVELMHHHLFPNRRTSFICDRTGHVWGIHTINYTTGDLDSGKHHCTRDGCKATKLCKEPASACDRRAHVEACKNAQQSRLIDEC